MASVADGATTTIPTRTSALAALDQAILKVSQRVAAVGVLSILTVAFLTVLDIVLRNFFSKSLYGLGEITVLLIAIAVSAVIPAGMAKRVSLTIEILESRVSPATLAWLKAFGAALLGLFLGLIAWRLGLIARTAMIRQETTIMREIPKAPFYFGVSAGLAVATFVQIIVTLREVEAAYAVTRRGATPALVALLVVIGAFTLFLTGLLDPTPFRALRPSNPVVLAGVVFAVMWVFVLMMVPLGAVMGFAGIVGAAALLGTGPALEVLGSETRNYLTQESLAVLPLFLLMGTFASVAGIGSDIYRLAHVMLGHFRGGIAHATIAGCAAFGALTGSSMATQMTIGRLAMPEMRARGYSVEISAGTIAAGGTLGQLVPPATALILYAVMAQQSVGKLFMATIIPGIIAALLYMGTVMVWVHFHPEDAPQGEAATWRQRAAVVRACWAPLLLLTLVLGGIYGGFFTEIEAGSVGAAGAFLLAVARGRLTRHTIWEVMSESTATIALMYALLFGTLMLSFFFGITHLPEFFIKAIDTLSLSPLGVVIALVLCYLILGTAMDSWAMMVITVPIFVPIVTNVGYDPIWWGIMTVICMEAGQISPPFGLNIFLISSIDPSIPVLKVFRGCWPFFWSTCVKIAILIAFPSLTLFLVK